MAPEIYSVYPSPGSRLRDRIPRIVVGFRDALSGIYGEENYRFWLDGLRLIVEYDPEKDVGFYHVEKPLRYGNHTLEVRIRDRSGNIAESRSLFSVVP